MKSSNSCSEPVHAINNNKLKNIFVLSLLYREIYFNSKFAIKDLHRQEHKLFSLCILLRNDLTSIVSSQMFFGTEFTALILLIKSLVSFTQKGTCFIMVVSGSLPILRYQWSENLLNLQQDDMGCLLYEFLEIYKILGFSGTSFLIYLQCFYLSIILL